MAPRCPTCGVLNPEGAATCAQCGRPLRDGNAWDAGIDPAIDSQVCPACQKSVPAGSRFCAYCGATMPPRSEPVDDLIAEHMTVRVTVPPVSEVAGGRPAIAASLLDSPTADHALPGESVTGGAYVAVPKIEAWILELKTDGTRGEQRKVEGETSIGRQDCDLTYSNDALLSPRHATLEVREGRVYLKDADSLNGTFVKQRVDSELAPGDVFLLGRDLFRFNTQALDANQTPIPNQTTAYVVGAPKLQKGPVTARLEHIQLDGQVIEEFGLEKPETTIGRTRGDLVFKGDPYMSGIHARVVAQPGRFLLQDLKSKNGVYRRIRQEVELKDGDEFFLGEQLFRMQVRTIVA
ncbi:MAG TPA: FHA domain-containing protein [Terriglobia bacterium]|nr:FHA domain-containing protein [Terriglobia bacterium]